MTDPLVDQITKLRLKLIEKVEYKLEILQKWIQREKSFIHFNIIFSESKILNRKFFLSFTYAYGPLEVEQRKKHDGR